MAEYDVNFSELPEQTFSELESGVYVLKIDNIIKEEDPEYGMKYTMTHEIVNTGRKINYDNYKIYNGKGQPEVFGQGKLRKLIEALGLTNLEKINVKVLQSIAVGKMFKANCDVNDKGFLNIRFADIYPLDDPREALNADTSNATKPEEVSPQTFEGQEVSTAVIDEINDDDI